MIRALYDWTLGLGTVAACDLGFGFCCLYRKFGLSHPARYPDDPDDHRSPPPRVLDRLCRHTSFRSRGGRSAITSARRSLKPSACRCLEFYGKTDYFASFQDPL